ncbi:MAG: DNA internalization-related competence protein ComEC/Rec2 [Proteobacteria bacterium]|nr:DNA internalization-related competence protein ComEC/Rec2 [Pseudomonadota bacterium]
MRSLCLAVVCGIVVFHTMPSIPHCIVYLMVLPSLCSLCGPLWLRVLACCALGFLWAMWRADSVLQQRLDPQYEGAIVTVIGRINEQPSAYASASRMVLDVLTSKTGRDQTLNLARLQLNWYDPPQSLTLASKCELKVRLKVPHGVQNPGGFDREKWLFTERVSATGYVVEHPSNRCEPDTNRWSVNQIRQPIASRIRDALPNANQHGIVLALSVAQRSALSTHQWDVLRDTGTAHLLAISGLHISLIAGATFVLAHWTIGLAAPPSRQWPVQRPAAICALLVAMGYAALAGFPTSAERALVMFGVAMACVYWRRRAISADAFFIALAAVAVIDPLALLSSSYWLSFCAVGWLLLITTTAGPAGNVARRLLRVHLYLALGLTPVLGILYQSVPMASPVANLIAVPIVTMTIVPLVIVGIAALPINFSAAKLCWTSAAWIWDQLWLLLEWLASHLSAIELPVAPTPLTAGLAALGVLVLVIPVLSSRWFVSMVLLSVLLLGERETLSSAQFRVTVLDVGQGLAVVVETASKTLIYDTGPAFGDYSAGQTILTPFLRSRGVREIDRVVLSHADNDHAGGWPALAAAFPIRAIVVSPNHDIQVPHQTCRAGERWQWDGVDFAFLYPASGTEGSRNNLSCVLRITAPGGTVLLPGDIEDSAENNLVSAPDVTLLADVLVAPHHGSSTSSTSRFISAVSPNYVVFAAGYGNRFDFPRPEIVTRYLLSGATVLTTGTSGAIEFEVKEAVSIPERYRVNYRRYWHHLTELR